MLFKVFGAQAVAHLLWYISARGVVAHNVFAVVLSDATYTALNVLVLKECLEYRRTVHALLAVCAGGALGTWLGMVLPLFP